MRRALVRIAILLFVGAVVTLAVSWWCGWRVIYDLDSMFQTAHRRTRNTQIDPDIYHVTAAVAYVIGVRRTAGAAHVQFMALRADRADGIDDGKQENFDGLWRGWGPSPASWGPHRHFVYDSPERMLPREPFKTDMTFEARGWPMLATWCEMHGGPQGGFQIGLHQNSGTFATTELVLPYRPIWFGFAVNTVFYAIIVGALWLAPGKLRRIWRIKRGQCPSCAYPIGQNERCTECGATLPPSVARTPS